jgi:tetratricopeptide (TPR) repeat protein
MAAGSSNHRQTRPPRLGATIAFIADSCRPALQLRARPQPPGAMPERPFVPSRIPRWFARRSAACMAALTLLARSVGAEPAPPAAGAAAPEAADAARAESAAAAFQRGEAHKDAGRLEEALIEYERAYEILPAYPVLYCVGAVNMMLERWAAARRAFQLYLQLGEGKLEPADVQRTHSHLEQLYKRTATLTLELNVPGADVHIDGTKQEPTTITGLILEPGQHVVRVTKPGFEPLEQVVKAANGESLKLVVPLVPSASLNPRAPQLAPGAAGPLPGSSVAGSLPLPAAEPTEPTGVWLPWGITGALTAAWATTAVLASQARRDRDIIERPGTSAERLEDARRLHITLAVVSDVFLASALASAGVSAYLTWWSNPASAAATNGPHAPSRSELAIGVRGHF